MTLAWQKQAQPSLAALTKPPSRRDATTGLKKNKQEGEQIFFVLFLSFLAPIDALDTLVLLFLLYFLDICC